MIYFNKFNQKQKDHVKLYLKYSKLSKTAPDGNNWEHIRTIGQDPAKT